MVDEIITLPATRTSHLPLPPNKYFLLVNSSIILFYDVWWVTCVDSRGTVHGARAIHVARYTWHVNNPTGQKMGYACSSEQLIRLYIQKSDTKLAYWYETGILKRSTLNFFYKHTTGPSLG